MAESIKLVRDLMTVGVRTCPPATPIVEVARLLLAHDLEAVVVLDQEGHAVGTISQDALVRAYAHQDHARLRAEDIMQDGMPQVPPDIPLTAAAQIMLDQGWRAVYMTHHAGGIEYPAAVLTFRHLLRHLAAEDSDALADLGIKAEREAPLDQFIARRDAARQNAEQRRTERRHTRQSHEE